MFRQNSNELRALLVAICAFPYATLAVSTRSFRLWIEQLFKSVYSLVLFTLTFVFIWFLFTDFGGVARGGWTLGEALHWSLTGVSVLFIGLVLVIIFTAVNALFRPALPLDLLIAGFTALFHVLFLYNLIVVLFA
jgi:hypothetical protein